MRKSSLLIVIALVAVVIADSQSRPDYKTTEGTLFAIGKTGTELGQFPLKRTEELVDVSGFIARVRVKQEFTNVFGEPIEAAYRFPLSQRGAVDDMTMTIGTRVIRGRIMRSEEARELYEKARNDGKTASLREEQRPNIFTQSVANSERRAITG